MYSLMKNQTVTGIWLNLQGDTVDGDGEYTARTALKSVPNMEDTYGIAYNANASAGDLPLLQRQVSRAQALWAQTDGYMNELTDTVLYNCSDLGGHHQINSKMSQGMMLSCYSASNRFLFTWIRGFFYRFKRHTRSHRW